jgi:hypothetical protein
VKLFKLVTLFLKRKRFNIAHHGKVPCRNIIELWVGNFRMSSFALKRKPAGSVPTVGSPQNIEAVRQSFIRSARRSARRHPVALGICDLSVRRMLHKDLNFHPYQMVAVQELSDRDMANSSMVAERLIVTLSDDFIVFMMDEAQNFHCCAEENPQKLH